jgi:hypothetical protein
MVSSELRRSEISAVSRSPAKIKSGGWMQKLARRLNRKSSRGRPNKSDPVVMLLPRLPENPKTKVRQAL